MTKDEAMKLARDACPYFDEISKGAFYEGFITALDQLPDTTKMMEPLSPDYKEIALDLLAHLTAATSLLERGGKKAAPSNVMFNIMLNDYKTSCERAREALTEPDMGIDRGAWSDVPDATKWVDELRGDDEQPERESVVLNQFLSDVMTAAGLVRHGKQCKALAARLQVEVMRLHTALRAALEQPEQEPFGYFHYDLGLELWQETGTGDGKPLYTAPPKQEFVCSTGLCHYKHWVGLTDEAIWLEYQNFWPFHPAEEPTLAKDIAKFARAIEAKLKELNHD